MSGEDHSLPVTLDRQGFEHLFKTFFPSLCLFAQKYLPDSDSAREVVHNVFLALWEKRETIDTSTSLKSYLFTSVHNRCLNFIRDQKKFDRSENRLEQAAEVELNNPESGMAALELEEKILAAVGELPEKCREIFLLNRFEGMKYAEIADKLNISQKTVEAQMSRALKTLREKLVDYLGILILFFINHIN